MIAIIKDHFNADNKTIRNFGIILAVGISILFYLVFPVIFGASIKIVPGIIAGVFLLLSFSFLAVLRFFYVPWMIIGAILNYVNTRIILGLVFFIMFTPIALYFKIIKRDFLGLTLDKTKNSYRVTGDNIILNDKPF